MTHQQDLIEYLNQISQTFFCVFHENHLISSVFLNFQSKYMTGIIMLISPDGNRIVILSIVSFNNTCNNAFVSTSSWENIKQDMRVKLEFSIFTISKDRMTVLLFVIAKQLVSFIWKIVKLTFFSFFFCLGFLSRTFTIHRTVGEGGEYLCNSSLPLSHASQTSRH